MEMNANLDPDAMDVAASTVDQLRKLLPTLAGEEREFGLGAVGHPDLVRAVAGPLGGYLKAMDGVLGKAKELLADHDAESALQSLWSAHAMTMAQLVGLDIAAERVAGWTLSTTSPGPVVQPIPQANPPPSALQSLFNKLGQIGAWLWSIIQTLLIPKGWSVEGGIGFPGLASAKLKVEFGK
jgi:hypothetical protein